MTILGIDPGIALTGWGVIKKTTRQHTCVDVGVIKTSAELSHQERLEVIYDQMKVLLGKFKPDVCVLEQIFFSANVKTALIVGQARGVVMLVVQQKKIPVYSYTPLQVKQAITGYGRASKRQIQQMIKTLLKLDKVPKPDDAADALAVALTHGFSNKSLK